MRIAFTILLFSGVLIGCKDLSPEENIIRKHQRALGKTRHIKNLISFANCLGPDGAYTTRTASSFTDDYLLFQQDYSYKSPFYALIYSKSEGYGLDTALTSQGALSEVVIAVLKAHEFHELMMQPESRYSGMNLLGDTIYHGQNCVQLRASDHLGLPVRLYFDKHTKLMAGMSQANPYSKGQIISVHFDDWEKQDGIQIFKKVEIDQGKEDKYLFQYKDVSWNVAEFRKITLE